MIVLRPKSDSFLAPLMAALMVVIGFSGRTWFESDPITHVLIQFPLYIGAGVIFRHWLYPSYFSIAKLAKLPWFDGGYAGLLAAFFGLVYWMLPRNIDLSVGNVFADSLKTLSLVLLVGFIGSLAWQFAHPLLRGFVKAQSVSMLMFQAFLYTHAPNRLCLSYLVNQQVWLGYGFLLLALVLVVLFTFPLFYRERIDESA